MKSNFAQAGVKPTQQARYVAKKMEHSMAFYAVALVLAAVGLLRFGADEAQRLMPLLSSNALTSWLYLLFDARGAAAVMGIAEVGCAVALMWRTSRTISIVGGIGAVGLSLIAVCSALLAPGVAESYLLKDVVVAVAAMWALTSTLRNNQTELDAEHNAPTVADWHQVKVEPVLTATVSVSPVTVAAKKEEQVRTRMVSPVNTPVSKASSAAELREAARIPSPLAMALFACVDRAEQRLHVAEQASTPAPAVQTQGEMWPTLYSQEDLTASLERLTPIPGPRAGYAAAATTRH